MQRLRETDSIPENALAAAAWAGNTGALKLLLDAGAKPTSQELALAVLSRNPEAVRLLFSAGDLTVSSEALEQD